MFNNTLTFFFFSLVLSFSALANNPFAKSDSIDISKDIRWKFDKEAGVATKSKMSKAGIYYHLRFDNKQLELTISQDAEGLQVKPFDQLDIKNVKIDGKRSPLFSWCLNNQEGQDRFLQQGLNVKNNVCVSDGSQGRFVMQLDGGTLESLKNGRELLIVLKPYRTPLELHYELADFNNMVVALNTKPASVASNAASPKKQCFSSPPTKYKSIPSVEYNCASKKAKQAADEKVTALVYRKKTLDAEQRKLGQEKKRRQQAVAQAQAEKEAEAQKIRLKQEEKIQAQTAAVAASEAKQVAIGSEITQKMVSLCEKYWNISEHRCYCQKYIEYAPSEIQKNSTCQ
jgi:hypothetical protein